MRRCAQSVGNLPHAMVLGLIRRSLQSPRTNAMSPNDPSLRSFVDVTVDSGLSDPEPALWVLFHDPGTSPYRGSHWRHDSRSGCMRRSRPAAEPAAQRHVCTAGPERLHGSRAQVLVFGSAAVSISCATMRQPCETMHNCGKGACAAEGRNHAPARFGGASPTSIPRKSMPPMPGR